MFSGNYSSNPYLASNCVPLPEGYHVPSPRWWSVIHILLGMALPWYQYSWVSTSWYCWVEQTSCMGFSWVVQLAGWFNGVFPASIEPSSYSCRIAELCQSLVSYLVHESGSPVVVGNGWWWLLSGDPDGFGSVPLMIWGHSICMWVFDGVCWYMLLTSKVESLLFSCPNDACRVPHAAYIDYPKNCHEGQRGGAQIWAPMDPHNCEEEHFLCSAGTRKSRRSHSLC